MKVHKNKEDKLRYYDTDAKKTISKLHINAQYLAQMQKRLSNDDKNQRLIKTTLVNSAMTIQHETKPIMLSQCKI